MEFLVRQTAGPFGRRAGLQLRVDGRGRVVRARDADEVATRLEVAGDVEEHGGEGGAVGGVVEEPGAEDEVEGAGWVGGWFRAVGEEEVDGVFAAAGRACGRKGGRRRRRRRRGVSGGA